MRDLVIGAVVVATSAGVAGASHNAHNRGRVKRDRKFVQIAANQFTYQAISDAWAQSTPADGTPLEAIKRTVPLRYVGAHQQAGTAIILTFAAHHATCIDLVSTPAANTTRTRPGC
ncbi:MAG TPA: hypothetical protein VGR20_23195 [Acidimicrobiia bacterium]|jgi:hypothetical protein|nr:hypothetical protein [Acidimicrobiia bacterium]